MSDWDTYYKKHVSRKPREQLVRAVLLCTEKHSALDLGAGTLVESAFLLESGFEKVIAVDNSPQTKSFAETFDPERFELIISSFQDFNFKENQYDLINAQYALPFHGAKDFSLFVQKVKNSLTSGGIFVGQFFGTKDEWNTLDTKLAFQTKEEIEELLSDLEIIELTEEEKDGGTASGNQKHWHVFNFIVKNK